MNERRRAICIPVTKPRSEWCLELPISTSCPEPEPSRSDPDPSKSSGRSKSLFQEEEKSINDSAASC